MAEVIPYQFEDDDIIIEILSWLPAKSLLRFRCVCKSWRALISDSYYFIEKHRRRAVTNPSCINSVILSPIYGPPPSTYEAILLSYNRNISVASRQPSLPQDVYGTRIVGSCNGLVCLGRAFKYGSQFCLWNPCTGETSYLPLTPATNKHPLYLSGYGFGYDYTSHDYKVMFSTLDTGIDDYTAEFFILSLKKGLWTAIDQVPNVLGFGGIGHLYNGVLHWPAPDFDEDGELELSKAKIISFDLAKETFREVLVPLPLYENRIWSAIWVYKRGLFVSRTEIDGSTDTVWMTKEHSQLQAKQPWTKLAKQSGNNRLVFCFENADLLFSPQNSSSSLVLHNPKEESTDSIALDSNQHRRLIAWQAITHVETLVSPLINSVSTG